MTPKHNMVIIYLNSEYTVISDYTQFIIYTNVCES